MRLEELLAELVRRSMGELERVVVATQDGVAVAASNPSELDDLVAALGAAIVAGCDEAFKQNFSTGVSEVMVELEDERRVLFRGLGDKILCLVTRRDPNLGLVYYLLDKYSSELAKAGEEGEG
ncbi:MAG: hypothetical protein DRK00_05655 [Thermoprotei archaeon]|nr:MAG: hypothetical protein DRK00_05655 [Thermoprotei archaeon]